MITVLGLGFVGLTTALGFSKKGFKVYGIDVNKDRVANIAKYQIPFYEPNLDGALKDTLGENFILDAGLEEAVNNSKVVIICVGTPGNEDGSANLTYLLDAVKSVFEVSDGSYKVIVTKSTVPPSTLSKKVKPYVEALNQEYQKPIGLASNPEFLREGYAWDDFMNPDRIVIGVEDPNAKEILSGIYLPFSAPIHFVSYNSAEFIKYLSNSLLSTLISFSNEMAMIAEAIGDIDIPAAFKILHQDKRWSGEPAAMASYVFPGCGYGGYCLPKDTAALESISREYGFEPKILKGNLTINDEIKEHVVKKIMGEVSKESKIGILGLSFKSGSDDVRHTPSMYIIKMLLTKGYNNIVAYDPMAMEAFQKEYNLPIGYADSLENIVEEADVLVLLTGWPEFKQNKEMISQKKLLDFRYTVSPDIQKPVAGAY